MTISAALQAARPLLATVSPQPHLDAALLLSHVLGQKRDHLEIYPDLMLTDRQTAQFTSLVTKRQSGYPLAYLLGTKEFHGLTLKVTPDVLIPRPATESLVTFVSDRFAHVPRLTVADIGTGSGAIALALANRHPGWTIIATDISLQAIRVAQWNARQLGLMPRIQFSIGSLLAPLADQSLDVIIANLPYLRTNQLNEPTIQAEPGIALDGGPDGLVYIAQLIAQTQFHQSLQTLILEISPDQVETIRQLWQRSWPSGTAEVLQEGAMPYGIALRVNAQTD